METRAKATGFYRDDAARIAADAARVSPQGSSPALPLISLDEPNRPPLSPEPALNQNARSIVTTVEVRPRLKLRKILAWVLLAPWYVALMAISGCILVLVAKSFFGL